MERRGVEHARLETVDRVDHGTGKRVGAHEDVGPGPNVRHDRDGEVIGEREDPQDPVLFAEREHPVGGLDPRGRGFVRQHHALAPGGGPGGEPDEGGVQRVELGGRLGFTIEPLEPEAVTLAALHVRDARAREDVGLGPGEAAVQLDIADDLGGLGGREIAGERDQARARGQEAEGGRHICEIVRRQEPDPLTGLHTVGLEKRAETLRLSRELPVAEGAARPHVGQSSAWGVPLGRRIEKLDQVHCASAYRAAARPTASPVAKQVPITRAEPSASCVALMQRPATKRLSTSRA